MNRNLINVAAMALVYLGIFVLEFIFSETSDFEAIKTSFVKSSFLFVFVLFIYNTYLKPSKNGDKKEEVNKVKPKKLSSIQRRKILMAMNSDKDVVIKQDNSIVYKK